MTVVSGAEEGDNLVEVAIIPVADEQAAKLAVEVARPSVLALVTGASSRKPVLQHPWHGS